MRTGIYSERICRIIEDFPTGEPFTNKIVAEILKKEFDLSLSNAELITNNKLKRMFDEGKIGRIEKGVYYVPKKTVFGEVKPDYDRYAVKMLTMDKDNVIGYESGSSFFNRIGLSTLIPKVIILSLFLPRIRLVCLQTSQPPPEPISSARSLQGSISRHI